MITSFIEMLELPNFGLINTSTIYFDLRDKILFSDGIYRIFLYFQIALL